MRSFFYLLTLGIVLSSFQKQSPVRIIFFGDSITQMGVDKDGYIWQMQQYLQDKKLTDRYELIGAGIGGNKVYDLYLRHETDVLAKRPDVVVIYIGVNDVWHKTTHGTGTDADKFERFYKALIEKMTNAGIKVVLATPAGIGEKKNNANPQDADLNRYSDIIRKLAASYQLPLVDLRQLWQQYNEANNSNNDEKGILTTDRVHLNQTGNALVANAMLQVLGISQPQ